MGDFIGGAWVGIMKGAAAVGGFFLGLFGPWDMSLNVLLGLMIIDYLSGLIVAFMGKSRKTEGGGLNSKIGFNGLLRKGLIVLVVFMAAALDAITFGEAAFRTAACCFYIANEGLSVTENLAIAGVPFPKKIKDILEQMKDKEKE